MKEKFIRCILLLKIVVFIVKHLERRLQYIILTPPTIAIQFWQVPIHMSKWKIEGSFKEIVWLQWTKSSIFILVWFLKFGSISLNYMILKVISSSDYFWIMMYDEMLCQILKLVSMSSIVTYLVCIMATYVEIF